MRDDYVGSLQWGQQTGGALEWHDKARLGVAAIAQGAAVLRSWAFVSWRLSRAQSSIVFSDVPLPESAFADTVEAAAGKQARVVLDHARRSYGYAFAFATDQELGDNFDLLWAACVLHDIALSQPSEMCFAVRGGEQAYALARQAGLSTTRAELLGDTISRHATPSISRERHPLAYLVAAGALADLVALGLECVAPQLVQDLHLAFPRGTVSRDIPRLWKAEARRFPEGRAAVVRCAGFTGAIQLAHHVFRRFDDRANI